MRGRLWTALAVMVVATTSSATTTTSSSSPSSASSPSDTLLDALLRLRDSLNSTDFCYNRVKTLWGVITQQKRQIDGLQKIAFDYMNKMAALQMTSPIVKSCPSPFIRNGGGCFYSPKTEKTRKWVDARRACGRLGGDLAHPGDVSAFRNYVRSIASGWGFFFLGGRSDPENAFPDFRWVDGRRILSEGKYTTEFYHLLDTNNCILMESHGSFKIKDKECDSMFRRWYICEIKVLA